MNLLKTLVSISGLTLLSRIAGLVRETLTARIFGAGATTDAFFIAFRIPNLLRRLFAEGAFSQAFIPLLSQSKSRDGEDATKLLIDRVATVLFWAVSMVTILGIVFVNGVLAFMASGLVTGSAQYNDAAVMTQVMFPYIVFMAMCALSGGVLNTWKNFSTPAFSPVLLNIVLIASMMWLSPYMNPPILGLAIGVFVGGVVQLVWQLPAMKRIGMLPRISFDVMGALRDEGVRRVLKQMVPATLAVSVSQVSLIINTNIATHLGAGAVSWITYADRLMEFPSAMLGVALGTILLPSLSRAHSTGDEREYKTILNWGLRLTLLLALPAAVGLGCMSTALTSSLFHYGHFSANDVMKTSQALTAYSFGLIGLIAVKILASAYYAKQDIKTPVKIAVFVLLMTQAMNYIFVPIWGHAGLSLSIGLGACLNAGILSVLLARRGDLGGSAGWMTFFAKLCVALLVLAAVSYGLSQQVDWIGLGQAGDFAPKIQRLAWLFGIIVVSAVAYFAVLFALGFRFRDFKLVAKG